MRSILYHSEIYAETIKHVLNLFVLAMVAKWSYGLLISGRH